MAGERVQASLASRILHYDAKSQKRKFSAVSEEDTTLIIENQKNINTLKKTKSDISIFTAWLKEEKNEQREPESIPSNELDKLLAMFILAVRNCNTGDNYEPDTLVSKYNSIGRYLREKGAGNINADEAFRHSRQVLAAKKKELKTQGLGNKKNRAEPFAESDIARLKEKNLLGAGQYVLTFPTCAFVDVFMYSK